jgi:signal transduction histidine kinase
LIGFLFLFGKVGADEFTKDDETVVTTLGSQAALAFVNSRRYRQIRKQANQLRTEVSLRSESEERLRNLAARLERVREDERTGIARELHDELGQALTAIKFDVLRLPKRQAQAESAGSALEAIAKTIDSTIETVQRISSDLRPGVLDLGLGPAIEWQAAEFQRRTQIQCELMVQDLGLLHPKSSTTMFRILQETLTNVARHSGAKRVDVTLEDGEDRVTLTVADDGIGIEAEHLDSDHSLGIVGMRERVTLLGGELAIFRRPDGGTAVRASIPKMPHEVSPLAKQTASATRASLPRLSRRASGD